VGFLFLSLVGCGGGCEYYWILSVRDGSVCVDDAVDDWV